MGPWSLWLPRKNTCSSSPVPSAMPGAVPGFGSDASDARQRCSAAATDVSESGSSRSEPFAAGNGGSLSLLITTLRTATHASSGYAPPSRSGSARSCALWSSSWR